jgi:hypothetical protein
MQKRKLLLMESIIDLQLSRIAEIGFWLFSTIFLKKIMIKL